MRNLLSFLSRIKTAFLLTIIRLWAFIHESAVRFGAISPPYFRRLGRYLQVIFALCVAFQATTTDFFGQIVGYQIVPAAFTEIAIKWMAIGAAIGKFITVFSIDDSRLTAEQRRVLDELHKLQHPDPAP